MPLAEHLIVYPNHGAGSACGKMMSKETTDTLGHQKEVNYALRADMSREEFVTELLKGLTTPPGYFPQNVLMNIKGYESLEKVMDRATTALKPVDFEFLANESGALMLDTRDADDFARGFIPNSINIGLDGSFAQWVGEMIPDVKQPILLITDPGKEEESITRLSRVGYDNTLGYLEGGFDTWKASGKEFETSRRITSQELERMFREEKPLIIDVRKKSEFDSQHLNDAVNIPLNELNQHLDRFPKEKPFVLHCGSGYRSMIAASILKQRGWEDFADLSGGFDDLKESKLAKSEYVCPTTLL
jgi:rhodanese-related sulfurtransferase